MSITRATRQALGAAFVLTALGSASAPHAAHADTVNFDDLSSTGALIPNGYHGLNWNNIYADPARI
jgi:hypothetical protein